MISALWRSGAVLWIGVFFLALAGFAAPPHFPIRASTLASADFATSSATGIVRVRGRPIQDCRVRAVGCDAELAVTDSDGRYSLAGLPAREFDVEVHVPSSNGFSRIGVAKLPLIGGEERHLDFDLSPLDVEVVVAWPSGQKAWNLRVELFRFDGDAPSPSTEAWGITDADGRARLAVPATGRWRATAEFISWGRGAADFEVTSDGAHVSFPLHRTVKCAGRVALPDGGNVRSWWRLHLRPVDDGPEVVRTASMFCWVADGSRDFSIGNAVPGRYVAQMLGGGGQTLESAPFTLPEVGAAELVLPMTER